MISWWVPYLPKGYRPDFNNGPGGDSNSGPVLGPQHSFESDSNNVPSPGHSNLVSDEVHLFKSPTYGFLVVTMLAKGPMPDFNNGQEMTQIVAAF